MIDERSLHPLDETLMHQAPWPFHYASISDHRFFDRYWFIGVDPAGTASFVSGLAFYKNMGVCDGFFCVLENARQHNSRFSRSLAPDTVRTQVGGLSVEVVEPFRELHILLDGSTTPMTADLAYTAELDPACEAHYVDSRGGRVGQEITRYHQPGRWNGWLDHGDGRIEVRNWWGTRDHSWGVRPGVGGFDRSVADPRAAASSTPTSSSDAMMHVAMVIDLDDGYVSVQRREDRDGRPTFDDAEVVLRDGRHVRVVVQEVEVHFTPGTRQYEQLQMRLARSDGRTHEVVVEPLLEAWAYAGTGYDGGYADGKGLGAWRGEKSEHDVYVHHGPEDVRLDGAPTATGHREQLVRATVDGHSSVGYCAVMTRGALPRHGLT